MLNIIFIAPPAAGKGTLSSMISSKYNIPHISMGDILRDITTSNSELSLLIKERLDKGEFIDDDITIRLLKERLNCDDVKNGLILDGFPRDKVQAEKLEDLLNNKIAIFLNIEKAEALRRILGRLICQECHQVYNTTSDDLEPKTSNICDRCGSILVRRTDDNEETFIRRFDNYLEETKPVIDFYKNKNILFEINALDNPKDTFKLIEKIISEVSND